MENENTEILSSNINRTINHSGTSFTPGIGDKDISSNIITAEVKDMTISGQTYQNILPKPTTLIMETDEQEFKINDKIDSNIIIDDNIAEIATVKGKTIVNAVQEESASEYTVLGEDLSGQSIAHVKETPTLEGSTLVNLCLNNLTLGNIEDDGKDYIEQNYPVGTSYPQHSHGYNTVTLKSNTTYLAIPKYYTDVPDTRSLVRDLTNNTNLTSADINDRGIVKFTTNDLVCSSIAYYNMIPVKWGAATSTQEWTSKLSKKIMIIEYVEGMENWDIPYFEGTKYFEANIKGVTLQGQTLVNTIQEPCETEYIVVGEELSGQGVAVYQPDSLTNIYDLSTSKNTGSATINGDVITLSGEGGWVVINNAMPTIKKDTTYTIIVNILSNTLQYSGTEHNFALNVEKTNNNTAFLTGFSIPIGSVGLFKYITKTKSNFSDAPKYLSDVRISSSAIGGQISFTYMIIEGDYTNVDLPYFEGTKQFNQGVMNLEGDTLTNILPKPSLRSSMENTSTQKLNTRNDVVDVDGELRGATLKGKTLVNLVYNYVIVGSDSDIINLQSKHITGKVLIKNLYKNTQCYVNLYDLTTGNYVGAINIKSNNFVLNIPNGQYLGQIYDNSHSFSVDKILQEVMVIEYEEGMENWDIPYFEGMASVSSSPKTFHVLPEPSLRNSMENKAMQKLNEGHDEVVVKNGEFKSAILKGNTLFNIAPKKLQNLEGNISNTSGATQYAMLLDQGYEIAYPLIANKEYLIIEEWNIKSSTNVFHTAQPKIIYEDGTVTYFNTSGDFGTTGVHRIARRYTPEQNVKNFYFGLTLRTDTTVSFALNYAMIIEYQEGMENWDIPYFEGMQSVEMPVIKSIGKNLFNETYYDGWLDSITGNFVESPNGTRKVTDFIDVTGGETYTISGCTMTGLRFYDINKKPMDTNWSRLMTTITAPTNAKYLRLTINSEVDYNNVQIEKGSIATSYEPYKSNILTCNEEVVLRGIGDVKDELNLLTGELTQRIGEYIYNGENVVSYNETVGGYLTIMNVGGNIGLGIVNGAGAVSDKLLNQSFTVSDVGVYGNMDERLYIYDKTVNSAEEFIAKHKGTTFAFVLTEPSVRTVDLTVTNQDNVIIDKPLSYKDGHIQVLHQEGSLLPSVSYEIQTTNSYHIDMATVGEKYTVKGDNTNELITYSEPYINDDTNLMVIKGDYVDLDVMGSVEKRSELVNVVKDYDIAKTGKTFVVQDANARAMLITEPNETAQLFKSNTKYLIQFEVNDLVLDGINDITLRFINSSTGNDSLFSSDSNYKVSGNGIHRCIRTTTDLINTSRALIKGDPREWEESGSTSRKMTISNIMFIEYHHGMENWNLPYFEGTYDTYTHIKPIVKTVGKNVFDITTKGKERAGWYSIPLITPFSGTIYVKGIDSLPSDFRMCFFDGETEFTLANDRIKAGANLTYNNILAVEFHCPTMSIELGKRGCLDSLVKNGDIVIQLNNEPYKSSNVAINEEIVLRGIGDVKDELNVMTGELTQRIGEIVLDGSEDWATERFTAGANQFLRFRLLGVSNCKTNAKTLCDKEKVMRDDNANEDYVRASINLIYIYRKDLTTTVEDLKQQLQANPYTVQYELATESIKKVDLTITNQYNTTINKPLSYKDGHIQTQCEGNSLLPNVDYEIPTSNSYHIDTFKQGTTYTVQSDTSNTAVVLTSANTNPYVNSESNLMLIEGDYTSVDIPYFEGTKHFEYSTPRHINGATLEGQTHISLVTSMANTMENTSMQKLNEGHDDVIGVDGEYKGATLKGNTLVNMFKFKETFTSLYNVGSYVYSDNKITIVGNGVGEGFAKSDITVNLESNKTYTFKGNCDKGFNTDNGFIYLLLNNASSRATRINTGNTTFQVSESGVYYVRLDMRDSSQTYVFSDLMILEGDYTNVDIPYFTGMTSVKMPVLTTTGKNIFKLPSSDEMLIGEVGKYIKLNLKPNTDYVYNSILDKKGNTDSFNLYGWISNSINGNYNGYRVFHWDNNDTFSNTFNTGNEVWYFHLLLNNRVSDYRDHLTFQLEESSTATSYEPYKSNILTCNEEVTLRGIGDVKDELNVLTGELTQRIEEDSLLDVDSTISTNYQLDNHTTFFFGNWTSKVEGATMKSIHSNKLPYPVDKEGVFFDGWGLYLRIKNDRLTTLDSNGLREWMIEGDFRIIYRIKTPITKTVGLTITNQDNTTINKPLSYKDGHIQVSSQEGSLLPSVNYEIPTLNSVRADKLKLNTTYTFKNNGKDFAPTFNINGANHEATNTFSLSQLNDDTLVITSQLNDTDRVSLVEGNVVGTEVPYFEGMKSVENPIVKVTGKNLFNVDASLYPVHTDNGITYMTTNSGVILNGTTVDTSAVSTSRMYDVKDILEVGKTYGVSVSDSGVSVSFRAYMADGSQKYVKLLEVTSEYTRICVYIQFVAGDSRSFTNKTVDFQIEETLLNATSYEPYKSTSVSSIEDITLRAIGDVKDELDLSTGTLTQRIGEVVLNGYSSIETWALNNTDNADLITFDISNIKIDILSHSFLDSENIIKCDKLPINTSYKNNCCILTHNDSALGIKWLTITVKRTELSTLDVAGFRSYLNLNPVTVQYQLATPIIHKINLQTLDQDGNEVPTLKLQLPKNIITTSSDCLVPNINIPANINYDTIIKPSTQYTLRFNQNVNTDNPLTVNLGGTEQVVTSNHFTITTPATLAHNQLQFSGKGNIISDVQVIEGDVTTVQYPFFEGMNDVKFSGSKFIARNCPFIFGKGGRI